MEFCFQGSVGTLHGFYACILYNEIYANTKQEMSKCITENNETSNLVEKLNRVLFHWFI